MVLGLIVAGLAVELADGESEVVLLAIGTATPQSNEVVKSHPMRKEKDDGLTRIIREQR